MSATARDDAHGRGAGSREGARDKPPRPLKHGEKVDLAILAMPTFALGLAITIVSTQMGEVVRRYTHQATVIGLIIGGEGVMALWVPLIFGSWSDTLRTRIGGRLPFVLIGGMPAAVALALVGLVHGLGLIALMAALFFVFYFIVYEPYRALYPDMLPAGEIGGRAQSTQAVARGAGTGCALLCGGLLLSVNRELPFGFAAVVVVVALAAFVLLILRRGVPSQGQHRADSPMRVARRITRLIWRHRALRAYLFANALWEMTLAALKAFIVLYLNLGLGYSLGVSSLLIGGVSLVILVGAAGSGKLADRFGRIRVVSFSLCGYGAGYLVLVFTTSRPVMGAMIPLVALGGGTVMSMAYALLMPLMPEDEHGALTGFYSISRGIGITLGPILAGALIWATRNGLFKSTHGYQAMWIVCAAASFASIFFLRQMARASGDRHRLRADASSS